ncbi:MAG: glutamate racemase [Caulobacter sp. 32-67-35]|nr:MAG: glutamate racemase [Caulobacter sp. 32-67-35]
MSIGVFDSGVGGLSVHRALVQRLPQADFTYLADIALRRLQQTWLPGYRQQLGRPINILGIIVPTIEAATGLPWEHEAERRGDKVEQLDILGVFSTPGTAKSRVYEIEIDKRKQDLAVFSEPCPNLARMIEADTGAVELAQEIDGHVQALKTRIGRYPDRVVLGCTHYEIVADIFRAALPAGTPLIQQPAATADALELYLQRHPELDPGTGGSRVFLTTGEPGPQNGLVESFWGGPLRFEAA